MPQWGTSSSPTTRRLPISIRRAPMPIRRLQMPIRPLPIATRLGRRSTISAPRIEITALPTPRDGRARPSMGRGALMRPPVPSGRKARSSAAEQRDLAAERLDQELDLPDSSLQAAQEYAAAVRARAAADRAHAESDREQAEAQLRQAQLDHLTGAFGRELGMVALEREINRARHGDGRLVLAFVDGLKQVNDLNGHAAGDALLRDVVGAIQEHLRVLRPDRAGRRRRVRLRAGREPARRGSHPLRADTSDDRAEAGQCVDQRGVRGAAPAGHARAAHRARRHGALRGQAGEVVLAGPIGPSAVSSTGGRRPHPSRQSCSGRTPLVRCGRRARLSPRRVADEADHTPGRAAGG